MRKFFSSGLFFALVIIAVNAHARQNAAGLKPSNLIVSYCHIGQRATVLYFTAKMLGYDAKMYDGSWEVWRNRKELPTVQGEAPGEP